VARLANLTVIPIWASMPDLFASHWGSISNDQNPETEAQYHLDAREFLAMLHTRGIAILVDPPVSKGQKKELYDHPAVNIDRLFAAGRNGPACADRRLRRIFDA
jgi:hypothetical protein